MAVLAGFSNFRFGKRSRQNSVFASGHDRVRIDLESCWTFSGVPYEITTHTSDMSHSGTNADVYVVLYGRETCTEKKSLCATKSERKKCFEKGQVDKFVLEVRALRIRCAHQTEKG